MSDVKNRKIKWGFISLINFILLILLLCHFPIMTNKMHGESPLCWYRFAVYVCEYDSETSGNTTLGGDIFLYYKVGVVAEYFLLQKITGKMQ